MIEQNVVSVLSLMKKTRHVLIIVSMMMKEKLLEHAVFWSMVMLHILAELLF